jgi:signal transduction histidine kinase/CheY-like chemotaxis protein
LNILRRKSIGAARRVLLILCAALGGSQLINQPYSEELLLAISPTPWPNYVLTAIGYVTAGSLIIFGLIRGRIYHLSQQAQQLTQHVALRTAELIQVIAAKDELFANLSHEIRNPMNGILGIAENLCTDQLDAASQHKFNLLQQCARHLSGLVDNMLDFSRIQAGAYKFAHQPFLLGKLLDAILALTHLRSEKLGITIKVTIAPGIPKILWGDAPRVQQILLNLVDNALKFSRQGQVSITIWDQPAEIANHNIVFAVSDDGPGIPLNEQSLLFTRFARGANAQQNQIPGTGLGLALSKCLAEQMKGRLWLESTSAQGSSFHFCAPLLVAGVLPAPITAPTPLDARGQYALIIDDEAYNRIVLTDLLRSLGFTVHTAAEGTTALKLVRQQDYQVIFLDYNLPDISGLEVSRAIRLLPNASAAALVIATTAYTTPEKRTECTTAGMNAFLSKPVSMERLCRELAIAQPHPVCPSQSAPTPARELTRSRIKFERIATLKGTTREAELALYLTEFAQELAQLDLALQQSNIRQASHYAHLLYGRCAFVAAAELDKIFREIETASGTAQWSEVQRLRGQVPPALAAWRLSLAGVEPIAPLG